MYILIPGATFRDRGVCIPSISEADVSDIVLRVLSDTLEEFGVEHKRLFESDYKTQQGDLVIQIALGYAQTNQARNYSMVDGTDAAAARLGETLAEWGRCCSFGHQVKTREGADSSRVRLDLFCINGLDAEQYLCRLTQLGRELAQTLADLTRASSQARRDLAKQSEAPAKIPDSLRCIFDCV